MTPKERLLAALQLREPDDIVPHWELEFQLTEEVFGLPYVGGAALAEASPAERDRMLGTNVEALLAAARRYDYSCLRPYGCGGDLVLRQVELLRREIGDEYMVCGTVSSVFGIPSGQKMADFCYAFADDPAGMHEAARARIADSIEWGMRQVDAGCDIILEPTDYCFNTGPLLSPPMFAEFVTPYLTDLVQALMDYGAYVMVHTDGDIMPILDDLASTGAHALHSLDPMAGVDIAEVKRRVGDRMCIMGNVHCAMMQTGTPEDIANSARYALRHGMPGGGYIYSTSNVAFKGMPVASYDLMLEVREQYGRYPIDESLWAVEPTFETKPRPGKAA